MDRILSLAIVHVASALEDHPEGATDELLAEFAIDQVSDTDEITDEEWLVVRSPPFRAVVQRLVLAAHESADRLGSYRLTATPTPQFVSDWRAWASDVLLSAEHEASG